MTPAALQRLVLLVGLVLATASVTACAAEPPSSLQRISHPTSLAGTTWQLVSIQGRPLPAGPPVTITFQVDRIGGDGPCNSFGGSFAYEAASGRLQIADLGSTKRACVEPVRNEIEAAFFQSLRGVADASGDQEGRLVLTGTGAELVFAVGPVAVPVRDAGSPPAFPS